MNRRAYLKGILAVGVTSVTSFSVFKWLSLNKHIDPSKLWDKKALIAELAELIIPATDTPGAKAAGVENFIIKVLVNCNSAKQQHNFFYGMLNLEEYAVDHYGKEFLKCELAQKKQALQYAADHAEYPSPILNKINNKIFGEPFFIKLKALTVEGYCSSMLGATKGLAYDYIPGTFQACIPLQPHQKSWATK